MCCSTQATAVLHNYTISLNQALTTLQHRSLRCISRSTPFRAALVRMSKAVFLYRGGSGCEELWKQIEHQDITLIEQSAEHAPAELILNARAYRRPRSASSSSAAAAAAAAARTTTQANSASPAVAGAATNAAAVTSDTTVVPGRSAAALEAEEVAVGGLLIKLSLPSSAWCRELAQLLHGLSGKA